VRRKTFDSLLSMAGLVMVVVLAVAGGLMLWGHNYIGNQVHNQLGAQKIFFPAANSPAVAAPEFTAMRQYGGQELTTGAQAEVYADHFIANHLKVIGGGKTYAQLSTEAQAEPTNKALAGKVAEMFQGETLRGLLLNAYAFGTMGTLAGIGSLVSFGGAALLLILSGLGLYHARKTPSEQEILVGHGGAADGSALPRSKQPVGTGSAGARFSFLPAWRGVPARIPVSTRRPVWADWYEMDRK
jgi:hypothetical protein